MTHVRPNGFTLLEMMVALAIVAIISAMAVPFIGRDKGGVAMRTTARQIAGLLREARSQAVLKNHVEYLRVNIADGSFGLPERTPQRLPRGVAMALTTTVEQARSPVEGTIRFYPDGSSTGGGVTLRQNGHDTLVLVDWLSGKTRIVDEQRAKNKTAR
jgi:general secretion pathway protein H